MKPIFTIVLLLVVLSFNNTYPQVNSNWQWSHPKPQGNDIRYLKMISSVNWVAVGYTGTLMRTTNAGVNWLVYSNYFGYYSSFLGQGKNIYGASFGDANNGIACGTQGWIARTTNGGVNWDSVGSSAGATALWNASFGDNNTVYIGGNSGMVLKSTNAGLNWVTTTSPSGGANRTIFALDANTVYTGSLNGTIYKSSNGGSSWTTIPTGSSSIIFGIYFFNANTGIVSGATGYVKYTTDGGSSWNTPSVSVTASETRIFARKSPDEIYLLGDVNNIYKSTDYGVTFTSVPYKYSGQPIGLATNTMDISGNTWLAGGVNGLLNISTNSGTSWTGISRVLQAINVYDIAHIAPGKLWAVGNSPAASNCILYSMDNGNNWEIQSNFNADLRSICMIDENNGWAVGFNGKTVKTTNGGNSWVDVAIPGVGFQTLICTQFVNVNTGWVFGASFPFKTTDAGTTWIQGSTEQGAKWGSVVDENTAYIISFSITNTTISKTTNGGTNWELQTYPNPGNLWRIKMINANSGYVCGDGGKLLGTIDGGHTWVSIPTPTSNNYTTTDWSDINNGVLGAGSGFAARTTNKGQSWIVANTGGSSVWSMRMVHPDTIWSTQAFGYIFKYMTGATIGITEWRNEIPESFILKQNYPNPFNPSTTIEFALKKAGNVSLRIYDISGKLIDVIFDNMQFNAGTIKYNYNASNLSSGTYFYSLDVDNRRIDTKKMTFIK